MNGLMWTSGKKSVLDDLRPPDDKICGIIQKLYDDSVRHIKKYLKHPTIYVGYVDDNLDAYSQQKDGIVSLQSDTRSNDRFIKVIHKGKVIFLYLKTTVIKVSYSRDGATLSYTMDKDGLMSAYEAKGDGWSWVTNTKYCPIKKQRYYYWGEHTDSYRVDLEGNVHYGNHTDLLTELTRFENLQLTPLAWEPNRLVRDAIAYTLTDDETRWEQLKVQLKSNKFQDTFWTNARVLLSKWIDHEDEEEDDKHISDFDADSDSD